MEYINKQIGNKGEDLSCQYLEQLGYEIIQRNYFDKGRRGEIDIISYKNHIIHFIEVKTVSRETQNEVIHETLYNPADKINRQKIRKMKMVAQNFLFENGLEEEGYQLDLIMVFVYDGGFSYKIEVIENINIK